MFRPRFVVKEADVAVVHVVAVVVVLVRIVVAIVVFFVFLTVGDHRTCCSRAGRLDSICVSFQKMCGVGAKKFAERFFR